MLPARLGRHGIDFEVPERLGRYRLREVIGAGSMGRVYRAHDLHLDRAVALKTIRLNRQGDAMHDLAARLRLEALAAACLAHPGIVAMQEYGEENGYAFLAMEYVEGLSLRDRLREGPAFAVPEAADLLLQLLDALQYAHERGVWHRDIKPANILLTAGSRVKLVDFGIAHRDCPASTGPDILGTPGFVAPEMYLGDTFDGRVDVFACGAVLYQLLTGSPPYVGRADEIMIKVCYETPLPPSMACGRAALRPYDPVVLRAMARRPEQRFATAAQFREALRQVRTALPQARLSQRRSQFG
jgi:serine/threonine-protein kinase